MLYQPELPLVIRLANGIRTRDRQFLLTNHLRPKPEIE